MARLKAGKIYPKMVYGDAEASDLLHQYKAARKLARARKRSDWQLAQATALDRRLIIGRSRVFNVPGQ
jgi:hypothetical protein